MGAVFDIHELDQKIWLATQKGMFFYEDERFQQVSCTPKTRKKGTLYSTQKGVLIQNEEPQSLGEIPNVEWSQKRSRMAPHRIGRSLERHYIGS